MALLIFNKTIKYIRVLTDITKDVPTILMNFFELYIILWLMFRNKEKKRPKANEKSSEFIWIFRGIIWRVY